MCSILQKKMVLSEITIHYLFDIITICHHQIISTIKGLCIFVIFERENKKKKSRSKEKINK